MTNKHLLPVYDRPMVYYPIQCLQNAGIDEIMVVTGGPYGGAFFNLLRNGEAFGLKRMAYAHQEGAGGIAQALSLAERFVDGDDVCVILGDNIVGGTIRGAVERFREQEKGARMLVREVPDPHRFGVVRFADHDRDRIAEVVEKPKDPPSNLAVIGIYLYDHRVFDICRTLKPSARGELEITDVNNAYIVRDEMEYDLLQGWWIDAGTVESLHQASTLVAMHGANKAEALDIAVQVRASGRPMRRATDRVEHHAAAK